MSAKKVAKKEKTQTISIPMQLFKRIEKITKETDFESVSSYVTYVLEEILAESEEEKSFTKEDEKRIKERLRALGYIE